MNKLIISGTLLSLFPDGSSTKSTILIDGSIKRIDEFLDFFWPDDISAKLKHRSNLARLLRQRPERCELVERNIIRLKSEKEILEDRQWIGVQLKRFAIDVFFVNIDNNHHHQTQMSGQFGNILKFSFVFKDTIFSTL